MRVWAAAHAVDDFYQGLVPAAVPYFVLERHFSYVGASGLALAATLGSALPQIPVGVLADRRRLPWMAPLGMSLAGLGAGLSGLVPAYPLVFALLLLSGIGIALFHPPAGRDARRAAGGSATAMSYFAAGGSVGFFIGPALVTPALDNLGLGATALFIPPAVLMGFVLLRQHGRASHAAPVRARHQGRDRFGMVRTVQAGNVALLPALWALLACDDKYAALPLALIAGLVTNIPFAVLVKLGQDYLPSRPGTAAGVTLGLAVSAGGLLMPLLGLVAEHHGPQGAIVVLAIVPAIAVLVSAALREPARDPGPEEEPVAT
jgi:FSR family fosmidomycin resistance protein-like MFS transporter